MCDMVVELHGSDPSKGTLVIWCILVDDVWLNCQLQKSSTLEIALED